MYSLSRDQLCRVDPILACSFHFWVLKSNNSRRSPCSERAEIYRPTGDQRGDTMPSEPGTPDSRPVFNSSICRTGLSADPSGPMSTEFPSGDQVGSTPASDSGSNDWDGPPSTEIINGCHLVPACWP